MKNLSHLLSLLIFFASTGLAADNNSFVRVTGEGHVDVRPDQVSVHVGIETKGVNLSVVKGENDKRTKALLRTLKKLKISEKDIQTTQERINPRYTYLKTKRRFDGYDVRRDFKIRVRDLSRYGNVIQSAVDAGVEYINGIQFETSKKESFLETARKKAMENAKLKASNYASVTGQKVGKALTIEESMASSQPIQPFRAMAMDYQKSSAPPISPGEITVSSKVTVKFELK